VRLPQGADPAPLAHGGRAQKRTLPPAGASEPAPSLWPRATGRASAPEARCEYPLRKPGPYGKNPYQRLGRLPLVKRTLICAGAAVPEAAPRVGGAEADDRMGSRRKRTAGQ